MIKENYTISKKDITIDGGSNNFLSKLKVLSNENNIALFDINIKGENAEIG